MSLRSELSKEKLKRRKKIIFISITAVLVLGALVYAGFFYYKLTSTMDKIHTKTKKTTKREQTVDLDKLEPISFLLMGCDGEETHDKGRADTQIIVTINPKLNTIKMVSIARDSRVEIPGYKKMDRINSAFTKGGPELAMKTVENLFDIPIDYFIQINFSGFRDMVNALGGITVNNKFAFYDGTFNFPKGTNELNGAEALAYVRMRYSDPRGDFGRQERQRDVIKNIVTEGTSFTSFTKFQSIFDAIGSNVKTNMSLKEMWKLKGNYSAAVSNIESMQVNAVSAPLNGVAYQAILHDEQVRIITLLREHLGLPIKDSSSYKNIDAELLKGLKKPTIPEVKSSPVPEVKPSPVPEVKPSPVPEVKPSPPTEPEEKPEPTKPDDTSSTPE
jgi:LCP family protein required for cell wall assembly